MIESIFTGTKVLTFLTVLSMLIVFGAMCVDLASGLYKAYQRGDAKRSYGLKRTMSKFILYEGGLLIAYGIDLLMHFAHFWQMLSVEMLVSIPVVTFLVAIFLLIVEGMSVKEKADEKVHSEIKRAEKLLGSVSEQMADKLIDALVERIATKINDKQ